MGLQSYMCAAGLPAWCPPPTKDPEPPKPFNTSGYGTLQLLFPASTAYLVKQPIGGSPEGQICYANFGNDTTRKVTSMAEMTVGGFGVATGYGLPFWLKMLEGQAIHQTSTTLGIVGR